MNKTFMAQFNNVMAGKGVLADKQVAVISKEDGGKEATHDCVTCGQKSNGHWFQKSCMCPKPCQVYCTPTPTTSKLCPRSQCGEQLNDFIALQAAIDHIYQLMCDETPNCYSDNGDYRITDRMCELEDLIAYLDGEMWPTQYVGGVPASQALGDEDDNLPF